MYLDISFKLDFVKSSIVNNIHVFHITHHARQKVFLTNIL
jgi:hypothetical protein